MFFFAGILAANWVGQEKLLQYGMLNPYYVGQLAYMELDSGAYFLFLLKRRMKVFGMTALFAYTRFGIFVLPGVMGWYAFSLGYLFVNALVCMKFQGMLLVLLSVFPQILFYAAAYFGIGRILFGKKTEVALPMGIQKLWKNPKLFLLLSALLCMAAGIWMEAYVNPLFLIRYIRRM
ncbi:MAG: stage II sporulation protein M [Acetatifactor sp.]|nr:stage II sporulation protein M [Acetatifactor sp.]